MLYTTLVPTLLLELMRDTKSRCMNEGTIGCSDLYHESVSSFDSDGTTKLNLTRATYMCLEEVELVVMLYLAAPAAVTSHLEVI